MDQRPNCQRQNYSNSRKQCKKKNLGGFGIGFWGKRPKEWSMQWLVNWASWKWKVSAFQKDFQHSERQAPDKKTIFTEGTPDADCSLSHQVSSWT